MYMPYLFRQNNNTMIKNEKNILLCVYLLVMHCKGLNSLVTGNVLCISLSTHWCTIPVSPVTHCTARGFCPIENSFCKVLFFIYLFKECKYFLF